MLQFGKQNDEALRSMLVGLNARDAALNYQQLHGLLFAMSCSPEPIPAPEWFELIWLNEDPQFDDAAEAKTFYNLVLTLFRSIEAEVSTARYRPALGAAQAGLVTALGDWCDGFLIGHQYLEDVWEAALDDLGDDELYGHVDAALSWALAFLEGDIVAHDVDDDDEGLLAGLLQFQQLLEQYRGARARIGEAEHQWSIERAFDAMEPAARDEPCPCGSGRRFAQCCLH